MCRSVLGDVDKCGSDIEECCNLPGQAVSDVEKCGVFSASLSVVKGLRRFPSL